MTLGQKQELFTRLFTELLQWCFENGYEVRIGEVFRTAEQHQWNVEHGRSKASRSLHQDKLAADLHITKEGRYISNSFEETEPIGKHWESLHEKAIWGGRWSNPFDPYHFELRV